MSWARYVIGLDEAIESIRNEADARLLEEQQPAKAEPPGTTLLEPDDVAAPPVTTSALEQADFATSRRVEAIDDRLEAIDTTIGSWGRPDPASLQSIFPRLPDPTITKSPASSSRVVRVQDRAELFPTLDAEPSRLDESQVGSVATLRGTFGPGDVGAGEPLEAIEIPGRRRFCAGPGDPLGGLMKSWPCTHFMFIRIPLRVVPPLRRGGRGGIPA